MRKWKCREVLLIIVALTTLYSLIPVLALYLHRDAVPYSNREVIDKLALNKGEYFEFVFLSDNHAGLIFNDSATLKLTQNIRLENRFRKSDIDFVLIGGDITFRGSAWDYKIYNKIRSAVKLPVISMIGNHDYDKGGLERFKKYIGEGEFSFSNRNSYFIAINTNKEAQFAKFEEELKKSLSYAHRFVLIHKPAVSVYQQSKYRPEGNFWSYRFMKLCEKYKVDIVLSGHEHMFKEGFFGGVKYITSGGGGMLTTVPWWDGGFLHYTVVKVYGDYVDFEKREIFPPFWELVTYYLWKDIFYFLKGIFI